MIPMDGYRLDRIADQNNILSNIGSKEAIISRQRLNSSPMKSLYKALVIAGLFSIVTAIAALVHGAPWMDTAWRDMLPGLGSFGCFGFLLGGIHAFDARSELSIKSSPTGRMLFGLIASLLLSVLWRWPGQGVALAALVGVLLGYFGMTWAEYVNF